MAVAFVFWTEEEYKKALKKEGDREIVNWEEAEAIQILENWDEDYDAEVESLMEEAYRVFLY